MKPGLAALVSPHTAETFLAKFWPNEAFLIEGLKTSIRPLTELPLLQSLDTLLAAWPRLVQVHLPDLRDEASAIDASAADAAKLFKNKLGLLFNNAETNSAELKTWLEALHADLGLPASTHRRCMIYATPDGQGTAPHFDHNINFVLQLKGTKTWMLARNRHVKWPLQRHTMGLEVPAELQSYCDDMPSEMPEDAKEYVLKPGSLLFVPRGFWHSTVADGEALALNFTFSQPTWIDLLTAALRSRLALSEEWRELADGVSSRDSDRRALAELKFDALLLDLTADLPNWQAADILGATEGF
jgi:50S ribosomal protein L16 3-hydroxylase